MGEIDLRRGRLIEDLAPGMEHRAMHNPASSGLSAEIWPASFDVSTARRAVRRARGIGRIVRSLFSLSVGLVALLNAPFRVSTARYWLAVLTPSFCLLVTLLAFATFLWWLANAGCAVATLARKTLPRAGAASILFAFFVPVVNLLRPYQLVKALDAAADPNDVAPTLSDADRMTERSYRAPLPTAETPDFHPAWTRAWWALSVLAVFVVPVIAVAAAWTDLVNGYGNGLGEAAPTHYADTVYVVEALAFVASALLTVAVVGQIERRLEERFRRLRDASTAQ